jgi:4-hydroxy-tetrahydrodipicolinate reductase
MIGLLGYGKMGKTIDQLAAEQGLNVVWRVDKDNYSDLPTLLPQASVVIEFSRPDAAFDNIMQCLRAGVPVVCGTTGWLEYLPEARQYALDNGGALLWSSNFSVGVNLFFALNRYLTTLMSRHPDYAPTLTETHHIHKLDAPSGTAVTLAQDITALTNRQGWVLTEEGQTPPTDAVPIKAVREGEVPGTHEIVWQSSVDTISIEHKAHSRTGFASGALLAAQWIIGKKGVFDMKDVLGI